MFFQLSITFLYILYIGVILVLSRTKVFRADVLREKAETSPKSSSVGLKLPTEIGYLCIFIIIAVNSIDILIKVRNPLLILKALELHQLIGYIFLCIFGIYVYIKVTRLCTRWVSLAFALFPLIISFGPVPNIHGLVLVGVIIPVLLYFLFRKYSIQEDRTRIFLWMLTYFLISFTLITGNYAITGMINIRYSLYYREAHGLLGVLAILSEALLLSYPLQARVIPKTVFKKALVLQIVFLFIAVGYGFISFREYRKATWNKNYAQNTYYTHAFAKKKGLPVKNLDHTYLERSLECRECHPLTYNQWAVSAHAYSAKTISFQKTAKALADLHGKEYVRHCALCHDPAAALSEDPGLLIDPVHVSMSEGVSCRACHYMIQANPNNGEYAVALPRSDLMSQKSEIRVRSILNSVLEHVSDNTGPIINDGSSCYPCHALESSRDGRIQIPLDNVTSFIESKAARRMKCHWCHMPRIQFDEFLYSWKDHRMFGSQYLLDRVAIEGSPQNKALIRRFSKEQKDWMASKISPLDQGKVLYDETSGLFLIHKVGMAEKKIQEQKEVTSSGKGHFNIKLADISWAVKDENLQVILAFETSSTHVAHDFPSSLFANITRTWFALELRDAKGRMIYSSGSPDELDHSLGRLEVTDDKKPIDPEQSQQYMDIINKKWIKPDKPYSDQYAVVLPREAEFPLTYQYSLKYLRYTNRYMAWITNDPKASVEPIVMAVLSGNILHPYK